MGKNDSVYISRFFNFHWTLHPLHCLIKIFLHVRVCIHTKHFFHPCLLEEFRWKQTPKLLETPLGQKRSGGELDDLVQCWMVVLLLFWGCVGFVAVAFFFLVGVTCDVLHTSKLNSEHGKRSNHAVGTARRQTNMVTLKWDGCRDGSLHDDWERFQGKYSGKESGERSWGRWEGKLLDEGRSKKQKSSLIQMQTLMWIVRLLTQQSPMSSGAWKKMEVVPYFHHIPN